MRTGSINDDPKFGSGLLRSLESSHVVDDLPMPRLTGFFHVFERFDMKPIHVPTDIRSYLFRLPGGLMCACLAGGRPDAKSLGLTEGLSIMLPSEFEQEASGNTVRVEVCARAARGADEAAFSVAYSTNEVGNSGWHQFKAGPFWQIFGFQYVVRPMVLGNGDYIGLLPGGDASPDIDIAYVTADVIDCDRGQIDPNRAAIKIPRLRTDWESI
jgi:hypothetical protein